MQATTGSGSSFGFWKGKLMYVNPLVIRFSWGKSSNSRNRQKNENEAIWAIAQVLERSISPLFKM